MNYLIIFGKPRFLGLIYDCEEHLEKNVKVVIESSRGLELGYIAGTLSEEQVRKYKEKLESPKEYDEGDNIRSTEPLWQCVNLLRLADEEDLSEAERQRGEEEEALPLVRKILNNHDLPMKIVDMEYVLDRKKLYFYFTSEQRVDFRCFVKDLAREFKTRIELRQIGARDEAKILGGLASCGNPCCCSYWMSEFFPICIRMVKEQNLALNPSKISGLCGRLMCCMSYEYDLYKQLWKDLPNPGTKIKTPSGNYHISGVDLASSTVRIRSPEGVEFLVPVGEFVLFRKTVEDGGKWSLHPKSGDIAEVAQSLSETFTLSVESSPSRPSNDDRRKREEKNENTRNGKGKTKQKTKSRKRKSKI
ncbi:regulatory iron-sulfur-containing complex subunit RicT [Acetomicrobium sp.]|uniref:PSP1 domain-containing protein n=1 Tax=Acetomicrobium sp. TaxID=1872099 RepID=UPI001BCC5539|nr:regulatory iron-sulfur-containing complex subunit RicT [Acetomicrobium sp.]